MTPPTMTSRRALLAVMMAGTMTLAVGACGRRGRPEPPSDTPQKAQTDKSKTAQAGKAQPTFGTRPAPSDDDDDDVEENEKAKADPAGVNPLPTPTSSKKKVQPYAVPKQPFFLDFLM